MHMALDQQLNMELEPQSPYCTSSTELLPYRARNSLDEDIHKESADNLQRNGKKTVSPLRLDHGHSEADSLYQRAWNEFQNIQSTLQ
ncbi:hypothetical protein TNIN_422831 [Trichonephila inaurata madagascariensis]|uniref:Uncharacterized protein n=1 Tax=Trichonephila inaurata madagascariensis TaxID=2747483 RepID=A0A8X6WZS5_9ARAC|nr:hypothetical protein TNIN_422831 [Trichonephila inaurata madagascariensis]